MAPMSPDADPIPQAEIVRNLCEKLRQTYVFPDIAEQICSRLEQHLEEGVYAEIEGESLALSLTESLQGLSQDEHLLVRWHAHPLPEHAGSLLQNQERLVVYRQRARLDNYGIHRVERLAGNVGFIDIRHYVRPSWGSGDTATAAMRFLANANGLIVDVRQCSGGNPGMVALISSYLFDGEPILLNSLYWRDEDVMQQYWTLPFVPGNRFGDKPVYVLTSRRTFSAGEEFAYNLQARQRATLVGETTGGGAHPGSPHRLHAHYEAFIPAGRAINPITNTNWEGVGVVPDVAVPHNEAFEVAYKMALESVIEQIGEPTSRPLEKLLEEAQAALRESA